MTRFGHNFLLLAVFGSLAWGAPKLRLSVTTIGPLTIPASQNGTPQTVEAGNFGDGALALAATSSATFAAPSVTALPRCTIRPTCNVIVIALNTSTLAPGKYTAVVTVSDPNAIDAPQTITVTVQIGSGVPDSIDLYSPAGTPTRTSFTTGNRLTTTATPPPGQTLSVAATGGGSFSFTYSYQVTAQAPAGTAEGDYRGAVQTSGSTNPADNKSVPVTLHVTAQPIAEISPAAVNIRAAQGSPKFDKWIQFLNRGAAPLTLSGATVNQPWLTARIDGTNVILTVDPAAMAPGTGNSATVTVASNARNGPVTIPVTGELQAAAAPSAFFQGVLDNALFRPGDPVAPGGLVIITGEQLIALAPTFAPAGPWPTALGGATVYVNDVPAPIYYTSATHVVNQGGQITFQIPYNTPAGEARVRVDRDGLRGNTITVQVQPRVPRLMRLGPDPRFTAFGIQDHAIAQLPDGAFPLPRATGFGRPAHVGETIVMYALGLGETTPRVTDGGPAPGVEPFARVPGFRVVFAPGNLPGTGVSVDPSFVGLTPGYIGLYQVNVVIPTVGRSDAVPVELSFGNVESNRIFIAIE